MQSLNNWVDCPEVLTSSTLQLFWTLGLKKMYLEGQRFKWFLALYQNCNHLTLDKGKMEQAVVNNLNFSLNLTWFPTHIALAHFSLVRFAAWRLPFSHAWSQNRVQKNNQEHGILACFYLFPYFVVIVVLVCLFYLLYLNNIPVLLKARAFRYR